ncbi:MAG TPA: PHP-associated domain-containing protein [Chloroflexota bacterium]|nr:PHP-associated domain-containing protein [Chloroflexota bacterium]
MALKLDLHAHTGHSKDSLLPAAELLLAAASRGISALAVTDHDTLAGALQAAALAERQPKRFGGIRVIAGSEVMTSEGEIIGLYLREDVPRGLTPEETIERMRAQDAFVLVPHPFDRIRRSRLTVAALHRVAHLVDAIEGLNARTTLGSDNRAAQRFATERNLLITAGSDAHVAREAGTAYVEIQGALPEDARALSEQLRAARLGGGLSAPMVHVYSKLATWRKKLGIAPAIQL